MHHRNAENCSWHAKPGAAACLDTLQAILNCASVQSCGDCVSCSERALSLFRQAARNIAANN